METTTTETAIEHGNGKARFKTAHDAMQFLMNHPGARHDRKHDVLTLKNPSLRCMAAIDYLKKVLGKAAPSFFYIRDGQTRVYCAAQFGVTSVADVE